LPEGRKKRIRRDPNTTRALILETAERLMLEEGYAAVSTRRVAKEAGLTGALVHYYYPTTDDLFIALHRLMTERHLEQLKQAPASDRPLETLWQFQIDPARAALGVEFLGLANHRKAIRQEIALRTEQARDAQAQIFETVLAEAKGIPDMCSPMCLATLLAAAARTLVNEESIGITRGHEDVKTFIAWLISQTGEAAGADAQNS